MNNSSQDKFGICGTQNLKEEELQQNQQNQSQKIFCFSAEEFHEIKQLIIKQFNQRVKQNSQILNQFMLQLELIKLDFINNDNIIDVIINKVSDQISENENEIEQLTNIFLSINDIRFKHEQYIEKQKKLLYQIQQEFEKLNISQEKDKLLQNLNELDLQSLNFEVQQKINQKIDQTNQQSNFNEIQEQTLQVKQYQYQLINQTRIKQDEFCYAIAFNNNSSAIVVGCDNSIKIFEFKNEKLRSLYELEGHKKYITTLLFFKKTNQFISGSYDGQIKIWSQNNQKEWINIQTLMAHNDQIKCIIFNSNEDLLISGSYDKLIKFWKTNNKEWQLDQIINCSSFVVSLSLNDSTKKLVSIQLDDLIQIYEQKGKKWSIIQNVNLQAPGFQSCFISDDEFACLLNNRIDFYKFNQQNQQYQESYHTRLKIFSSVFAEFFVRFVQIKSILLVKQGLDLYILKKQENNEYDIDQIIEFQSPLLYGNVSEDGQFLITWDDDSKEYQIRKLKEIV